MRNTNVMACGLLLLAGSISTIPILRSAQTQHTSKFVGEIMDSKCATTGSHEPIMKQLAAIDARDCTLKCSKDGSFVLYDADSKTVYQLSDQQKPVNFAGQKVKITGGYEEKSKTIEIESIESTR